MSLQDLPSEIHREVLFRSTIPQILNFSRTSKTYRTLCSNSRFWIEYLNNRLRVPESHLRILSEILEVDFLSLFKLLIKLSPGLIEPWPLIINALEKKALRIVDSLLSNAKNPENIEPIIFEIMNYLSFDSRFSEEEIKDLVRMVKRYPQIAKPFLSDLLDEHPEILVKYFLEEFSSSSRAYCSIWSWFEDKIENQELTPEKEVNYLVLLRESLARLPAEPTDYDFSHRPT